MRQCKARQRSGRCSAGSAHMDAHVPFLHQPLKACAVSGRPALLNLCMSGVVRCPQGATGRAGHDAPSSVLIGEAECLRIPSVAGLPNS